MRGETMIRIVAGAVGAGAIDTHILTKPTTHKTLTSNLPSFTSSSSSSSSSNPVSARLESVDGRRENRASGSFHNLILGQVPSQLEVENAVNSLQNFMHGISSPGLEFDWLRQMLFNNDSRVLLSRGYERICNAFRSLQTEPSFQRVVVSLSSDKAVWDAVLNNKVVLELRKSIYAAEEERPQSSNEPDLATYILRWIVEVMKTKIMELIENFRLFVNEIFQPSEREKPTAETNDQLEEKLRSSVLLVIVILLIVIVTRAQGV